MSRAAAIETRDLIRRFGERTVVDRLSLRIPEGIVYGFLGPNGAGKSTTLRILCGMLRPTAGEVTVAGFSPVRDLDRLKRAIGYMPQQFGLYDYLTVAENLAFYADLYLPSARAARDRTREVLAATGLDAQRDQIASRLSGGWRQRLALACAILHRPRVLFLDEPTVGVDPVSRRLFWDLLHELNDAGTTIFVTTHYMEEVERCHEVGLLSGGRLRTSGSPRELKSFVAERRELVTVIAGDADRAFAALRGLPDLVDIYFYGEAIHLAWTRDPERLTQPRAVHRTREALREAGIGVVHIDHRVSTMEDVFVQATGRGDEP